MKEALTEAQKAFDKGEIPIGAVIVKDDCIVGRGHNLTESAKDPTAHAEMIAIRDAAKNLGGWRLTGCSMYVTIEPCTMCAGAAIWARLDAIYIGSMDPKGGACGSVIDVTDQPRFNHSIHIETGIMKEECESIMKEFFSNLRREHKKKKQSDSSE